MLKHRTVWAPKQEWTLGLVALAAVTPIVLLLFVPLGSGFAGIVLAGGLVGLTLIWSVIAWRLAHHRVAAASNLSADELVVAQLRARVASAEERLRRLGNDAAHELRNPIAAARASLEAALRRNRSEGTPPDVIRPVLRDIQRLWVVVEGLVLLTRPANEVPALDLQPVSLLDLLSETIAMVAPSARGRRVGFEEVIDDDAVVFGDGDRLRLLLFKLLDNAVRFSPDGGIVALELSKDGSRVRLAVADSGPGIPPADLPHLFDYARYIYDALPDRAAGSGFGLSLAQRIAHAHGGELCVVNRSGCGCRFDLLLPRAPSE